MTEDAQCSANGVSGYRGKAVGVTVITTGVEASGYSCSEWMKRRAFVLVL